MSGTWYRSHAVMRVVSGGLVSDSRAGSEDFLVHLVLDNYATHKRATVRAWLAARPRYHMHYTPTYAAWLNQVERWFGHLTQRAIRRGSFRTVRELVRRIDAFVQHYNAGARPFAWTATADSILAKLQRLLQAIIGTRH
jgi:DDE superfamily endonuclease